MMTADRRMADDGRDRMKEKKGPSLEDLFEEIEGILEKMEDKDVALEESFLLFEDGMKKLKQCSLKIDQVEKKMLALNDAGELEILPPNGGVGA